MAKNSTMKGKGAENTKSQALKNKTDEHKGKGKQKPGSSKESKKAQHARMMKNYENGSTEF